MGKKRQKKQNSSRQEITSAEYFFKIVAKVPAKKLVQPNIDIKNVEQLISSPPNTEPSLIKNTEQIISSQPQSTLSRKEEILTNPNRSNLLTSPNSGPAKSKIALEKLEANFIKQNAKWGSKKFVTKFATDLVTQNKDSSPGKTISNTIKDTLPHAKTIGVLCWIGEESQKQGFAQKQFNKQFQLSLTKDKKGAKRAFRTYMLFFYLEALADASEGVFNQIIAKGIDKAYFAVEPYIKRLVKEISKRHVIPKDPLKSLQIIFQNTQHKYIKKHQYSHAYSNNHPIHPSPNYKTINMNKNMAFNSSPPNPVFPTKPIKSIHDIQKESELRSQAMLNRLHERQRLTNMQQQLNHQKQIQKQSYKGITDYHKSKSPIYSQSRPITSQRHTSRSSNPPSSVMTPIKGNASTSKTNTSYSKSTRYKAETPTPCHLKKSFFNGAKRCDIVCPDKGPSVRVPSHFCK
ncbi:TPA: hypothetical protein ACGWTM_002982 [Legionella pneumophila]